MVGSNLKQVASWKFDQSWNTDLVYKRSQFEENACKSQFLITWNNDQEILNMCLWNMNIYERQMRFKWAKFVECLKSGPKTQDFLQFQTDFTKFPSLHQENEIKWNLTWATNKISHFLKTTTELFRVFWMIQTQKAKDPSRVRQKQNWKKYTPRLLLNIYCFLINFSK